MLPPVSHFSSCDLNPIGKEMIRRTAALNPMATTPWRLRTFVGISPVSPGLSLAKRPDQFSEGRNGFGELWRKSVAAAKPETILVSVTAGRKNLSGRDRDPVTVERQFCQLERVARNFDPEHESSARTRNSCFRGK